MQMIWIVSPEPIMLLILPIILSRISHNFHSLFFIIPMLSPIILYYSSNLIVSLIVKLHMQAAKIVHFSAIIRLIISLILLTKLHCCFHIHHQINV